MTELLKSFNTLSAYKHNKRDLFSDFIELTLCTFLGNETEYEKTSKKYSKEEMKEFSKLLGRLLLLGKKTQNEILSELYMNLEIANKNAGQFFTPWSVAELMAKLTIRDDFKGGKILDPTVGAGITLIAGAKELNSQQLYNSHFTGIDIDALCVKMCALNFLFFNLNGTIIHGNALTLENWSAWETKRTYMGGVIHERKIEMKEMVKIKKAVQGQMQF